MKKFYPAALGKLCLSLILSLSLITSAKAQIVTYDTTFGGWNAIVTEDLSLHGTDSAAGIVFFPGIDQQTTNIKDLLVNGPHYLIKNGLWDGSVTLGNGVHHPFIISLQPPASGYPAMVVKPKIDAILARYRIKRNSFYFTGLSMGAWQANEFITYEATPGDHTYGKMVKAMVNLEGVEPSDDAGIYSSLPYPDKMGDWAKVCGGKELWVEGSQDWRDMQAGAQNMINAVPGSATYFMVTYGGGAHCCWNTEYQPNVTWTKGGNSNISTIVGQAVAMNVWQWLLRQGDTSMPGAVSTPEVAPIASAGDDPVITLPVTTVTLSGKASGMNGATIKTIAWKETEGPVTASIVSPSSVTTTVTGLTKVGNYLFTLTATDNNNKQATSAVTVVVAPAEASPKATPPSATPPKATPPPPPPPTGSTPPPTVSAGANQTVSLPMSTVTLNGKATGNGGAIVNSYFWAQMSGPSWVKFSNEWASSTNVGELVAGTYLFQFSASDNNGKTSVSLVTVTVEAAVASKPPAKTPPPPENTPPAPEKTPPTVTAGKGQKISLPASSVELAGTASGNDGAKIVTTSWAQVAGPEKASVVSPSSLITEVKGLTEAGTYIFQLIVTDNKGGSSNSSMTVWVEPSAATAPPTVSAGPNQTVALPTSSVTLNGKATGNDGAVVNSYYWEFVSGPAWVKFSNEWAPTTTISGLVAGTYVFQLSASDTRDQTSTSTMTLVVKAKPSATTTGPTAVSGNAAELTDSLEMTDSVVADQVGGLQIFPNPVHDVLNLRMLNNATGKLLVMVYNTKGSLVQALSLEKTGVYLEGSIDVSRLAQGTYILQVVNGAKGKTTREFIKL
jgi:hypothetical protein